jgi:hypothetical protein
MIRKIKFLNILISLFQKTKTTLSRASSREQRIYPTYSNNQRKSFSHLSLDKISVEQRLSIADINQYLERFEKIYHDSSSQQYLHQPIGSVV